MAIVILNIALTGFTGMLAWFLKELWVLYKQVISDLEEIRALIEEHRRHDIEAVALIREMLAEFRLEVAKDYVPTEEFKEFRDKYSRPSIHELRERIASLEGTGLFKKPTS